MIKSKRHEENDFVNDVASDGIGREQRTETKQQ